MKNEKNLSKEKIRTHFLAPIIIYLIEIESYRKGKV